MRRTRRKNSSRSMQHRGGRRAFLLSFAVFKEKKYIRYGVYRRFSLGLVCAAGLGCPALVGLVERESEVAELVL